MQRSHRVQGDHSIAANKPAQRLLSWSMWCSTFRKESPQNVQSHIPGYRYRIHPKTLYPETQRTPTFQGIYSLRQQKQTSQRAHILWHRLPNTLGPHLVSWASNSQISQLTPWKHKHKMFKILWHDCCFPPPAREQAFSRLSQACECLVLFLEYNPGKW